MTTRRIAVSLLATALLAGPASASLFLSDWGVSYGNWDVTGFDGYSDYEVEDWVLGSSVQGYIGPGWGGQDYDVEALYFGMDGDFYYFAMVTGFRPEGQDGIEAGDLFVDTNQDGGYEYAFDTSAGGALVSGITGVENPDAGGGENWGGVSDPFRVSTYTGPALTGFDYSYTDFDGRYALEVVIDKSLMGPIDRYHIHWTMGCGNDAADLYGDPVPEPATLLLVGGGLLGVVAGRRRRR